MDRLTVSGGVRIDFQNDVHRTFTLGPHRWLPNRNVFFDAVEDVPNWKDVNPRVSVGLRSVWQRQDGAQGQREPRRAAGLDRYRARRTTRPARSPRHDIQQRRRGTTAFSEPAIRAREFPSRLRPHQRRRQRRMRRQPEPELRQRRPGHVYDPRDHGRLGRAAVQLGVLGRHSAGDHPARVGCRFGYFRRINGNFQVTDNEALSRTDFTQYSATVPTTTTPHRSTAERGRDRDGPFRPEHPRPGAQRGQGRVSVRETAGALGRRRSHRRCAAAQRTLPAGRREHGQDDDRQLRHRR